ncbi:MAG: alpha/beta fold hydrolase [Bacillota bacterium]|nr:alpha/beta fold hydrolase [Bacillota bacterium]
MKKNSYKCASKCDGLLLDVLEYIPDGKIKGIVQISHGMAEHKERYEDFMKYLSENGYVACIHDHRGHGKSVKNKEELGYFYDETGTYIIEDVKLINETLKSKYPNVPLILFGHSMGSLVVRVFTKKYDDSIDKLIVCGSPSQNPAAGLALLLVNVLSKIKGNHHRSNFINSLAFSSYTKNIHDSDKNEFSWLSVNKENVQKYIACEYDGYVFTLNGFKNLFLLMQETYNSEGWKMNHPTLPIFYIAGSEDPCIVNKNKWIEAQDFMKKVGYSDVSNHLYIGYRHEILNEDIRESIYKDILEFIENERN